MNVESSPRVVVLAGGVSNEREVSLGSGRACATALARRYPTRFIDVSEKQVPDSIDAGVEVVFSMLHGCFGEDGTIQRLLDEVGVEYAGCGAECSELAFDKERMKSLAIEQGIEVASGKTFDAAAKPSATELVAHLGAQVVIKPLRGGSSVGLAICDGESEIEAALDPISTGDWLAETRIMGREVTVGILDGQALPVVEIAPKGGVFDYEAKYTKGLTEYLAPAPIDPVLADRLQRDALAAYHASGARDFARIDFMITPQDRRIFLEINTLPGMKETSLLPMGARCAGMDFSELVCEMIKPALARLERRRKTGGAA